MRPLYGSGCSYGYLRAIRSAVTVRGISPKDYSLAAGAMMEVLDKSITLEAADILEGDSTTASKCDFVISGGENS